LKVMVNTERCKGCGLCVSVCPKKIMVMDKESINSKGFNTAKMANQAECIDCAFCATICPDVAIEIDEE